MQQHTNSPAVESEVPFYLAENRYSPITLPSASIEFGGNEYHFAPASDNSTFGPNASRTDQYPVDALSHEHFSNHGLNGSQDPGYTVYDNVDHASTSTFL